MVLDDEAKKELEEAGFTPDLSSEKLKITIKEMAAPLIFSFGSAAVIEAATKIVEKLAVTGLKRVDLMGKKEVKATEDKVTINKVDTSAKDTDASMAKDEVKIKDGDLSAAKTDANALTTEATAAETGAAAARTKAGAADIETKALKMT